MRRIRIPLLTRAIGGTSEATRFVCEWQDIPPKLSQARLVVEVAAASAGGTGFAISLEAPCGDEVVAEWFGPVNILSPTSSSYELADTPLPARARARVEFACGGGHELRAMAYIEGTVP